MIAEVKVVKEQVAKQAETPVPEEVEADSFVWANLTEEERRSLDPNDGVYEGYQVTDFLTLRPKRLSGVELDYVINLLQVSRDWLKRDHYLPKQVGSPRSPIAFFRTRLRGFDGIAFARHPQTTQVDYDDAFEMLVDTNNYHLGRINGGLEKPIYPLIPDPTFATLSKILLMNPMEY